MRMCRAFVACFIFGISSVAQGATFYNEAIDGDLSDLRLSPTSRTLELGTQTLSGKFGPSGAQGIPDLDYLTVTVLAGQQISSLFVRGADVGGGASFIGVQQGTQVTVPYTTVDPSPMLGYTHFYTSSVGEDILPLIGIGPGAIGFQGPLGGGQYTFWIMELADDREFSYSFEFEVMRVPAPATATLFLVLAAHFGGRRSRTH
ncbi:MAG: hypothetical protein KGS45_09375 [Planctomycetes bacterium]|nr:hypothetical protein [Planctomycetota bacterium]